MERRLNMNKKNSDCFTYPSFVSRGYLKKIRLLLRQVKTPAYIIDEKILEDNLKILKKIKNEAGCKMLLALKAYSAYSTFPLISKYLDGVCASGANEARLGREFFKKEVHTYAPAYSDEDFAKIKTYSDTVIFNSFCQLKKYGAEIKDLGKEIGLRVNPGFSGSPSEMYNPCAPRSRLGITKEQFYGQDLSLVDGLHFHALCEQNSTVLRDVLQSMEANFGKYLRGMKWINLGGGHHITRADYDRKLLVSLIKRVKEKYHIEVRLEPGEAAVLNAGYLAATVLDIVENCGQSAILDASAETHMPDVLAMPYRPKIIGGGEPGEKKYEYRLGGPSCLAGDIIGDYSFDKPLKAGDKLIFTDMALYTFVKNTTFNGINLPDLGILKKNEKYKVIKHFGYEDFRSRLS